MSLLSLAQILETAKKKKEGTSEAHKLKCETIPLNVRLYKSMQIVFLLLTLKNRCFLTSSASLSPAPSRRSGLLLKSCAQGEA